LIAFPTAASPSPQFPTNFSSQASPDDTAGYRPAAGNEEEDVNSSVKRSLILIYRIVMGSWIPYVHTNGCNHHHLPVASYAINNPVFLSHNGSNEMNFDSKMRHIFMHYIPLILN